MSAAGGGAGIKGERSGLWGEMARIIGEICPRFVFIENSPVLRTRGLHIVLKNLAEMGYNARWGIIGARSMGGPIKRDRMWVLAYPSSNQKSFLNTESDLFDKEFIKNKLWSFETFSTLLECDKKRMPIISRDERVVNGMAHSVDRLAAIGNGQVPIVAATAFRLLSASVNK
jgi:DNA (cytosine-5)-methyltransferase 1